MSRMLQRSTVKKTFITCVYRRTLAGAWWVWLTLIGTAIRITCFTMDARDGRRYGILITTSEAPACLVLLFLPAEASWRWRSLMATPRLLTSFFAAPPDSWRSG